MLKKFLFVLLMFSVIPIFGCQKKTKEVKLVPENYKDWAMTASNLNYPIPGHENHYRQIFINKKGEEVKTEKKNGRLYYNYPKGTIIIKEIYPTLNPSKDDRSISLTVMIKDPENSLSRDGWVWVLKTNYRL
ncbi:MAG: hypothetical protein DRP57_12900 [Spirochaetes bacterium]|nr:MAG: hypothetical protein DRP57_12900 [Spirochaetota bacterium]